MPIISPIGRKSPAVRWLIFWIYTALGFGALTMLYPFALMVAGSTKSTVDVQDNVIVPRFLYNDHALYQKHIEGLFRESVGLMRGVYHLHTPAFWKLDPPKSVNEVFIEQWEDFIESTPLEAECFTVGYLSIASSREALPHRLREFKAQMSERFDGNLDRLNNAMGTDFKSWRVFGPPIDIFMLRRENVPDTPFYRELQAFKATLPLRERIYPSVGGAYTDSFLGAKYSHDIDSYNRAHGTDFGDWSELHLPSSLATAGYNPAQRAEWETFVRELLHLRWLHLDPVTEDAYRSFLAAKHVSLDVLNERYGTRWTRWEDVPFNEYAPKRGMARSDWEAFIRGWQDVDGTWHRAPLDAIRIESVETKFRDYLREQFGSLEAMNTATDEQFTNWNDVMPPQRGWHYLDYQQKKGALRWEFTQRNFIAVIDYIAFHGRGIFNTAVYCLLAVLTALLVNPLAAYALSRYKPPSAYKVLLFLMLTMAFPPMVTQIPVFLMLRDFNLLNTFWALILPGLANGYAIFLLKGFFDSLPRELYETAEIDGAGEIRIFWQITMSLSKPILAVIALNAFTFAYSNFMMALLICQDSEMWTLMPWLYQLQQQSCQGVVFASLLIAAIPTFMIFIFCQNIIMRGIVVPVEK